MRAPATLALLLPALVLAALPLASACSFAREPPRPATFTLVPSDGGDPVVIEVDGRMSGGDCGLANPFTFDDGVFAWMEYEWNPDRRTAVLHDLASGTRTTVELRAKAAQGFGLWDGKLLYREILYHESAPDAQGRTDVTTESTFFVHDTATNVVDTLPFPDGQWSQILFDGPRIVATLREEGAEPAPRSLYVYDVEQEAFVVEGRSLAAFASNTGYMALTAAGDGWLAFEGDETTLYEVATGETHDLGKRRVSAIVDGYAYSWESWGDGPTRQKLPDGPVEPVDAKGPIVGFVSGHTVLGQYAPPQPPEPVPTPPHDPSPGFGVPGSILVRIALFFAGPLGIFGFLFGLV